MSLLLNFPPLNNFIYIFFWAATASWWIAWMKKWGGDGKIFSISEVSYFQQRGISHLVNSNDDEEERRREKKAEWKWIEEVFVHSKTFKQSRDHSKVNEGKRFFFEKLFLNDREHRLSKWQWHFPPASDFSSYFPDEEQKRKKKKLFTSCTRM